MRVEQRLSQSVFGTAFTVHFNRVRQAITSDARCRVILGRRTTFWVAAQPSLV